MIQDKGLKISFDEVFSWILLMVLNYNPSQKKNVVELLKSNNSTFYFSFKYYILWLFLFSINDTKIKFTMIFPTSKRVGNSKLYKFITLFL